MPVIVIYPDYAEKTDIANTNGIKKQIIDLWDKLPIFRDSMDKVPTINVLYKKALTKSTLEDELFMIKQQVGSKRLLLYPVKRG